MARTITVKGVGSVSAKPNYVILNMSLTSHNMAYDEAMTLATKQIAELTKSLVAVGFANEDVKTVDFKVDTVYDRVKNRDGDYRKVFDGYEICHKLKVGFDFSTDRLSDAIGAISKCSANPELKIRFTVKEPSRVNEALLISATENARAKAEIICRAAKVSLGELLRIDYNWGEVDIYSNTNYDLGAIEVLQCDAGINFEPDDINVGDTVTFEWEIT